MEAMNGSKKKKSRKGMREKHKEDDNSTIKRQE